MNSSSRAKEEILVADVVVIGGGGTGLAAAAAAAEKGARVVLLEKQGIGGNTAMATGLLAADSLVQKSLNIVALPDDIVRKAVEFSHWSINQRLFRAFVNKSADTIQWLEDKGLTFQVLPTYPGQEPLTWHIADGRGAAVVKALRQACEDLGVQLFTQCPAKKIMTGGTGEITGVVASRNGADFQVNAKSVIIATGGYGGNKDLLRKYVPGYGENWQGYGLDLMGDGLVMAIELGAATEGLGNLMIHPLVYPGCKTFDWILRDPRGLWVNKKGERFTDESVGLRPAECGNAVKGQPDACAYVIWDQDLLTTIANEGLGKHPLRGTQGLTSLRIYKGEITPEVLAKELQLEAEKGGIRISDSLGEIAEWMGVAPESLNGTVRDYNAVSDRGYDEIFLKDRRFLRALRTPPYYAITSYVSFVTTLGGIKINHRMEVVNKQDDRIPGLYAGGDTTGGWESETYCIDLAGSAFGFAINSGRIAGENAAENAQGR